MSWSMQDRQGFVRGLDETRRRLTTFYRWFLIAVAVAFIAFVGVVVWRVESWGSQGGSFYFGLFVILVLGWIGSKILALRPTRGTDLELPPIRARMEDLGGDWSGRGGSARGGSARGRIFELRIGESPEVTAGEDGGRPDTAPGGRTFTFSQSMQGEVPFPAFLRDHAPDDAALAGAEADLAAGRDWDDVCARLQPAYRGWNPARKALFRRYVEALVDARRAGGTGDGL